MYAGTRYTVENVIMKSNIRYSEYTLSILKRGIGERLHSVLKVGTTMAKQMATYNERVFQDYTFISMLTL